MENQERPTPIKRVNPHQLSNLIHKWSEAIKLHKELEKQKLLQLKLIQVLSKRSILDVLISIFSLKYYQIKKIKSKIEQSRLANDNAVKDKMINIYKVNEINYEEEFKEILEECNERYDSYLSSLTMIKNGNFSELKTGYDKTAIPTEDVRLIVDKVTFDPPTEKPDLVSAYITMEEVLSRCFKA